MRANLTNLLLTAKAAKANAVATLVDRIGSGDAADVQPPAGFLFQGLHQPQLPAREPYPGTRQEDTAMRMPLTAAGSIPGARERLGAAGSKPALTRGSADASPVAVHHPRSLRTSTRLGRDCQSPDRNDARTDRRPETWQPATSTAGDRTARAFAAK